VYKKGNYKTIDSEVIPLLFTTELIT